MQLPLYRYSLLFKMLYKENNLKYIHEVYSTIKASPFEIKTILAEKDDKGFLVFFRSAGVNFMRRKTELPQ